LINIISPINQLGYGIAGLNILKALSKTTDVALWPIGEIQVTNEKDANACSNPIQNASFFDCNQTCLRIWHQHDMAQFVGKGKHIGFPIFELDTFNDLELHHLRSVDELFVCSEWAKDVIQSNKIDVPVQVVPLGVDTSIFKPVESTQQEKTIFFNCGKWEVRKGHDILHKAFKKVVESHENVELWMMCENPFNSPQEEHQWKSLYDHPKIRIIPRVKTQEEVYNIMRKVDCGVFPSRGEGWNLEALELMACGKHVIVTDYSAHTEFCTKDNADLVTINETELAYDGKWFHGHGSWAKIGDQQIDQVAQYMSDFHVTNINNHGYSNKAGIKTALEFSWDNSARKILEHV
jgi:glycosyltransferase involved in cell wall biosynthesis